MNKTSTDAISRSWLIAAFATLYLVWGSTYLAIRVAVETEPPFLLAGFRFLVAGLLMFAWLRGRGVARPDKLQCLNAMFAGVVMLVGGNGLVVWAEQKVPSSVAALLVALTPAWFALLEWVRPAGRRPALHTLVGMIVGFAGVMVLVTGDQFTGVNARQNPLGLLALILSGFLWAAGSLWSRYHAKPESPWMNAAVQMIAGGTVLLVLSLCHGEPAQFHLAQVSTVSWLALAYLIVFGSWIGFSAYVWLLKVTTPARLATYAYVNPVVAVLLGRLVLSEPFGRREAASAVIILAGVIITAWPKRD